MTHWRVSYVVDFDDGEADTPTDAALAAAARLATPGVPERGSYEVVDMDYGKSFTVDLDAPENGGAGFFS